MACMCCKGHRHGVHVSAASTFNGGISDWNVAKATYMTHMFGCASSFKGDLSKWAIAKVYAMEQVYVVKPAMDNGSNASAVKAEDY